MFKIASVNMEESEKIESEFSAFYTLAKIFNSDNELRSTLYEYFKNKPEYFDRLASIEYAQKGRKGDFVNKDNSKLLFGENISVSASKLDKFYRCPFSFLCQYGFEIDELKKAELKPNDSGTIIHGVLEEVLKAYKGADFLDAPKEELEKFVKDYLNKYLDEKMGGIQEKSKRFMYIYNRMVNTLMMIFERLKVEFASVDFKPVDFELSIGKKIPAYTLPLDEGEISVKGSIDRVDLMEKDGLSYIRVIDYKTGVKEFRLANLFSGINLQMVIYLMALNKNGENYYKNIVPAGVLYMPSRIGISGYLKMRNPSSEHVEAQKNASGKLSGMVLNSPVVFNGMGVDKLHNYLPVSYTKDKKLTGNCYSQKQFDLLSERVDNKIVGMGNSLHKGEFSVCPTGSTEDELPCKYCGYRSICGFEEGEPFNKLCGGKHGEALARLEGGDDNE